MCDNNLPCHMTQKDVCGEKGKFVKVAVADCEFLAKTLGKERPVSGDRPAGDVQPKILPQGSDKQLFSLSCSLLLPRLPETRLEGRTQGRLQIKTNDEKHDGIIKIT